MLCECEVKAAAFYLKIIAVINWPSARGARPRLWSAAWTIQSWFAYLLIRTVMARLDWDSGFAPEPTSNPYRSQFVRILDEARRIGTSVDFLKSLEWLI